MVKKFIAAFIALAMLAALMPGSAAAAGGQKHYNGLIGADSPLYGLKINIQKLDVALTFNTTDKLKKQMSLADERVAEAEDAADDNNVGAFDAATYEYVNTLDGINGTLQSEDINSSVATGELVPLLLHHQEIFYGIADNNTTPLEIQNRMVNISGEFMKIKNGMPFYYYNGTAYFMPPGQMKKIESGIINGSKVPPGLAKKGYKAPPPAIDNGSKKWPWDQIPYPTSKKLNGNGNGNGHGKGRGNK